MFTQSLTPRGAAYAHYRILNSLVFVRLIMSLSRRCRLPPRLISLIRK